MHPHLNPLWRARILLGAAVIALLAAACSDQADGSTQLVDDGDPAVAAGTSTVTEAAPAVTDGDDNAPGDPTTSTDDEPDGSDPDTTSASTAAPSARGGDWAEVEFTLETVANLAQPIGMTFRPGDDDLWLIERAGRVRRVARTFDETAGTETLELVSTPVIDITRQVTTEGEGGLLGIAFAPDGERLYLHYTKRNGDNV
ncbi:MAG: hypothetical protein AAFN30_09000, partial [Actinomycetota bacterium]